MYNHARLFRVVSATVAIVMLTACESAPPLEPAESPLLKASATPGASTEEWLRAVRQVTARFHSTEQAEMAGYAIDHHCVAAPGIGGMGNHWVNIDLVDPIFDPLKPEVILYAPGPNGKPQVIGVEYIVIDVGQDPPLFGDQPFDVGGTPAPVDHWSLHVWLFESNPSGTFAPFNPNVHCN